MSPFAEYKSMYHKRQNEDAKETVGCAQTEIVIENKIARNIRELFKFSQIG